MTTAPRITARVSEDVQALLLQATSLSGISSINAFVLSAAVEKAKSIVKEQQEMHLSSRDAMALVEALDTKPRHLRLTLGTLGSGEETKLLHIFTPHFCYSRSDDT